MIIWRDCNFRYDGLGRRSAIIEQNGSSTTETRYLWCEGAAPCQARTDKDVILRRYFEQGEFEVAGGIKKYYAKDQLGSIRDVLSIATGQKLGSYDYDAYGNLTTSSPRVTELGYAGMFYHAPSNLYLTWYRAYDPKTARWLSSDPIGLAGGINLYGYVDGNPISYTDRTGLARQLDPNGAECQQLKKKIQNKKTDINKRICEVKANPNNLPYYPPYSEAPPRMSVQGHEDIIQDLKDGLSDDEALYASKCGGGGGDGTATAPVTPAPDNSAAKNAAGAAVGAGAAYWIISESLRVLFPPRNLIPVP